MTTSGGQSRLIHQPAFDGLRGLAVAAVLVYHADFKWAKGGFLGVSTFFTLSGFLITSLLVSEWHGTRGIKLKNFYIRRVRRLLPASVITMVVAVVYSRMFAGPIELSTIQHDLLSAAGQVSNWWFIANGRSYGALFQTPSIVQHYWSLAVEEQFYLIVPPLVALALHKGWSIRKIGIAVVAGIGASMATTVIIDLTSKSTDRIYYGTDTRAVELLVGVLLALVVSQRDPLSERARSIVVGAGVAALVVSVGLWGIVGIGDGWLYHGGLWFYAICSGCIVMACREPGPVRTALSFKPLQELGVISYGVYLLHWPIYQMLTPQRLHTGIALAFVLRVVATLAAATLSFFLVEMPIRRGLFPPAEPGWRLPTAAFGSLATVFLVIAVVVPGANKGFDINHGNAEFESELHHQRPALKGAPRVAVFGDSTATALSLGVAGWAQKTRKITLNPGDTELGCGVIVTGEVRYSTSTTKESAHCNGRVARYQDASQGLDVAVVLFGPWDVADHLLPGDAVWRHVGDPVYDKALRDEADHLVSLLSAHGALVVWVLSPDIRLNVGNPPTTHLPTNDPKRMLAFDNIIKQLAAEHPYKMRTIDLGSYMRSLPGGEFDTHLRPDGVHLTDATAQTVVTDWFGPELLRIVTKAG